MGLARHGTGPIPVLRAYASQVHPVFMLPAVAAAAFGAIIAGRLEPLPATLHIVAIFGAVYTAHIKDGYIDFHRRGEDRDSPLTVVGCRAGLVTSTLLVWLCCFGLLVVVDPMAVLLTVPTWMIGYLHAPYLDMRPITATAGYPTGIALAILGGHYVQVQAITLEVLTIAIVFLTLLSGVKIVDDLQDLEWDRAFGKRTVGVTIGASRSHRLAIGLMATALVGVLLLAGVAIIPRSSVAAAIVFAPVMLLAIRRGPTIQTMLLIRGSYLFMAVLVAAVWWRPLA